MKLTGKLLCFVSIIAMTIIYSSCFKKDKPVVLPAPGDAKVYSVGMGSNYATQVYFRLSDGKTTANPFKVWDLAFETSLSGYHIWMNGGNMQWIANSHSTNFSAVTDTIGLNFMYDVSSWSIDSNAVGEYLTAGASSLSKNEVYVIDRGDSVPQNARFKKFIIRTENDASYFLVYANLDGTFADSLTIVKNPSYTYSYFNFENGQLNFEPLKTDWDILFTRYRYVFTNQTPVLPYLVNGVLLNQGTLVALDTTQKFDSIDLAFAQSKSFSSKKDFIGFGWKYYDFPSATYLTKSHFNYIIKDRNGVYFKLHFVDFYNDLGEKGYPKFELKQL